MYYLESGPANWVLMSATALSHTFDRAGESLDADRWSPAACGCSKGHSVGEWTAVTSATLKGGTAAFPYPCPLCFSESVTSYTVTSYTVGWVTRGPLDWRELSISEYCQCQETSGHATPSHTALPLQEILRATVLLELFAMGKRLTRWTF